MAKDAPLFSLGITEEKVTIVFRQQLKWVSFPPDQAIKLAQQLVRLAGEVKGTKLICRISRDEGNGHATD